MNEVSPPQAGEVEPHTAEPSERRPWIRPQLDRLRIEDTAATTNCGADGAIFS